MHLVTSWGHYKENSDYRKLYWVKMKEKRRRGKRGRETPGWGIRRGRKPTKSFEMLKILYIHVMFTVIATSPIYVVVRLS